MTRLIQDPTVATREWIVQLPGRRVEQPILEVERGAYQAMRAAIRCRRQRREAGSRRRRKTYPL